MPAKKERGRAIQSHGICEESTRDWWIPLTKANNSEAFFHVMTSSWALTIDSALRSPWRRSSILLHTTWPIVLCSSNCKQETKMFYEVKVGIVFNSIQRGFYEHLDTFKNLDRLLFTISLGSSQRPSNAVCWCLLCRWRQQAAEQRV